MTNEILYPAQLPAIRLDDARDREHLIGDLRRVAHWSNPARLKEEGESIIGLAAHVRALRLDVDGDCEGALQAVGCDLAVARAQGRLP